MAELKPYMVGENDMVAAENPAQAIRVFTDYVGPTGLWDDINADDDVTDMSSRIDMAVSDETGEAICTLRDYVDDCDGVPSYLYGWE